MGKYKRRADGRFSTSITVGYKEDGKPIVKTIYGATSKEVDRKKDELQKTLVKTISSLDPNISLFNLYYMAEKGKKSEISISTLGKYRSAMQKLSPLWHLKVKDIRLHHITDIISQYSGHDDTQRYIKQVVRLIWDRGLQEGIVQQNLADFIKLKKTIKEDKHRALTAQETQAVKDILAERTLPQREHDLLTVLFYCGLRTEELLALRYEDCQNGRVTISKAITFKGGKQLKEPKSQSGYRSVPLPEGVVLNGSGFLIHSADGSIVSESVWRRSWYSILTAINQKLGGGVVEYGKDGKIHGERVTDLTAYDFRHNFATVLYRNGVDVKTAQTLLGHSSVKMTLDIYTHLSAQDTQSLNIVF